MGILAAAATLAMASVLLWAALEKARRPSSLASVMGRLGVPASAVGFAAALLIGAELAIAFGLIFAPRMPLVAAGVLALSGAFAGAGLVARIRNEEIHCGCFGPGGGYLGKAQMVAFPFWLAGAVLLRHPGRPPPALGDAASSFALVGLTVAALRVAAALRVSRAGRADRLSALEMLPWLPR